MVTSLRPRISLYLVRLDLSGLKPLVLVLVLQVLIRSSSICCLLGLRIGLYLLVLTLALLDSARHVAATRTRSTARVRLTVLTDYDHICGPSIVLPCLCMNTRIFPDINCRIKPT